MQTVPLGARVFLVSTGGPDVDVVEHNRDGTIKLALFDGKRDHYLDVPPDAVALSGERTEGFKRAAVEQERRTRYPRQAS
jgi:hypothetical protein